MARSKVKLRSHHDIAHLHPLTNVPTKYQLPTPYGFRDIARTRFYRSRSLRQGQRSNQCHTMTLYTYTSKPMSLPSINFLHLTVSEIWSRQDFQTQGHYGKVKSRSHHDVAQLHPLTNVPTKYQLPTPTVSEIQSGQTFKTFKILFNLFLGNSKVYEVDIW